VQDHPLTVGAIVRHGTSVHADRQVQTRQPDGTVRVATFGDVGVSADSKVATFMWNNQEHVEACCAVPAMGAVLHTLNIRLTTEQIRFIGNHAEDRTCRSRR
jgi:fatty-acyl-CoA synthase